MSTTTTNLGLTKPEGTEYADVDVLNGNADIIDQAVGELQDSVSRKTFSVTYGANIRTADADRTVYEKSGNVVHIAAPLSTSAEKAAGDTILTIPQGYRPAKSFYFLAYNNGGIRFASVDSSTGNLVLDAAWSAGVLWLNTSYICAD